MYCGRKLTSTSGGTGTVLPTTIFLVRPNFVGLAQALAGLSGAQGLIQLRQLAHQFAGALRGTGRATG